ncbi:hypothetical protein HAP41_0000049495 (plasmid) [Bradyrhizobium barranii subsp. apii]|uniref:Uncharacterized protein n=1 Tax=Bradyrhizobium barranii subsp. apii TaxID=2819348 RepID=A0A8T5VP41_9BRAD|nr:hypothetical protein [Bradyrhizobium barranii]UPT92347.1 hypothetical protein HAP41_0000049495 [Bradyrhizobium barranii subsp. apii]
MEDNLEPLRDWTALERSAAWLPWHRSTVALSLLQQKSTVGTDLADRCVHWLRSDQSRFGHNGMLDCSPLGSRLLASLSGTPYAADFSFEIEGARRSVERDLGKYRQWARSFLAAVELGQLCPSRALWWIGNMVQPNGLPKNLRRKAPEDFVRFSNAFLQLRASIRERGPVGIIESIGVWLSMTEDNSRWRRLCRAIECEALDRLFAWPLVVMDTIRHEAALALPIFAEANPTSIHGDGSCRVIDGRVLIAPVPVYHQLQTAEDNPAKDSWRAFATEWANHARALLLNHNRHLGDEGVQYIKSVALSVDLGACDSVLSHVFRDHDPIPAAGRSASALFATAFAAAIMNRQMPKIAIIGDLVTPADGPVDNRRGPEIGQVHKEGLDAKISHVFLGEGYDALIVPRAGELKESDAPTENGFGDVVARDSAESQRIHMFESGVLSNVWDIAFPNSWRRYRSVRCPDASFSLTLDQASRGSIRDWFEQAEVVDDLPDWITITELASYLRWCSREIASLNPAPPGLSQFFMRLTEFETGSHAVLSLGEALRYPVSHLAKVNAEDSDELKKSLTDMLQPGRHCPETLFGQAPDLTILISKPEAISSPEQPVAEANLATLLKEIRDDLSDKGRRREWSEYVGRCRIILVQERLETERNLQLSEFDKAQTELSIFRMEFTQQQASAVVSETKWRGAATKMLLRGLQEKGAARYTPMTDSWVLTRKAPLPAMCFGME